MANDPAGRLLILLRTIQDNAHAQVKLAGLFNVLLGGQQGPPHSGLKQVAKLYELPGDVRRELEQVPHIKAENYLRYLSRLEDGLAEVSLASPISHLAAYISDDLLVELQICSDVLQQFRPDPQLGSDLNREDLVAEVEELIHQVETADLEEDLRIFLLNSLAEIRMVLFGYTLLGTPALLDVVDRTIGRVTRQQDLQRHAIGHPVAGRFFGLLKNLALALTVTTSTLQLTQGVFPDDTKPPEVDVNVTVVDRPGHQHSSGHPNHDGEESNVAPSPGSPPITR